MTMRALLDQAVVALARLILRVFYRRIEVVGGERLPGTGPLVVVANHHNSLVDAMMLLAFLPRRTRLLAKHTLWSHPVVGPLLALAGAYPVFRAEDGADTRSNRATFARCVRELARGGVVALFPEGRSHPGTGLLPLKSGAARLALQAAGVAEAHGLRVVPIAIGYEDRGVFRSRARLAVGAPLEVRAGEGARGLTARVTRALGGTLAEGAPWRAEPIPGRPRAMRLRAWAAAPLNWIPYRVPGWTAARLTTTADEPATYKVLTGLLSFPTFWSLQALAAAALGGPPAALGTLAAAIVTARLALPAMDPSGARARA
jgi:1-acyl-sn-glycerol-3-phosphate acyltransferase